MFINYPRTGVRVGHLIYLPCAVERHVFKCDILVTAASTCSLVSIWGEGGGGGHMQPFGEKDNQPLHHDQRL